MRSKYGAKPKIIDGIRFHSTGEANRYVELKLLVSAGVISALQLQVPFKLFCNGVLICKLVMDFVYSENGRLIGEDFKGVMTPVCRLKHKMFIASYPTYELRITR